MSDQTETEKFKLSHVEKDTFGFYAVLIDKSISPISHIKDTGRHQSEGGARVAAYHTIRGGNIEQPFG